MLHVGRTRWRFGGIRQRAVVWVARVAIAFVLVEGAADVAWCRGNENDKNDKDVSAANANTSPNDHDLVLQLRAEIEDMRAQMQAMRDLLPSTMAPVTTATAAPDSLVLPAPQPQPQPQPQPATPAATAPGTTPAGVPTPQEGGGGSIGVNFRALGDVGYRITDQKQLPNTFWIGSLDLLMTGRLSDHATMLGEVLFTPDSTDNSFTFDVERLMFAYKQNDYFALGVGRYHTSIGYYNTAFHRGEWFQTAIGRPFMYAFDDQGGVLPLQEVGATTYGQIPSGGLGLHYVFEVGNGRSHLLGSEPAQNAQDGNNGKSVNVEISAQPMRVSGLDVGFSIYHDYLTFSDNINHPELISTAFVVFRNPTWEFLNEAMMVRHAFTSTGAPGVFHTPGFYTQFSRRFGNYRPYFRYSYINAGVDEPIYGDPADGTVVGRRNGPTLGLRYDIGAHAAVKLQYDRLAQRGITAVNGLSTEFSFAY